MTKAQLTAWIPQKGNRPVNPVIEGAKRSMEKRLAPIEGELPKRIAAALEALAAAETKANG